MDAMSKVLGKDSVRVSDNFFDIGGHSLAASTFVGELSQLGIHLQIMDLYQNPTITSLVRHLTPESIISQGTCSFTSAHTYNASSPHVCGS